MKEFIRARLRTTDCSPLIVHDLSLFSLFIWRLKRVRRVVLSGRELGLPLDHEPPPQTAQVFKCLEQPLEVKELRFTVSSVVMMHGAFGKPQPGILKTFHHLNADRSARGKELHAVVTGAAHQPEITIHVSDLYHESELDEPAI